MSGGIAYVYDRGRQFRARCNLAMVALEPVLPTAEQLVQTDPATWHRGECDEIILKGLIEKHFRLTGSEKARAILDDWDRARAQLRQGVPERVQARALGEMHAARQSGRRQREGRRPEARRAAH